MIIFYFKEAFKSAGRAKSSSLISLISTTIAVALLLASLTIIQISDQFQKRLKDNIAVNVFLKEDISEKNITSLQEEIKNLSYVNSISYIDKKTAAENFVKETGEDFRNILDYNPLPASFSITFKENYVEKESLNKITASLQKLNGVEEVVFKQDAVYKVLNFLNQIKKYVFGITAVIVLLSIYIVYSTTKLIMVSKYEEIETMKLVGAKLSTIKAPIMLNGIFIGLLASLATLIIFILFLYYADTYIGIRNYWNFRFGVIAGLIMTAGPLLGFLVSAFALKNVTLKIKY